MKKISIVLIIIFGMNIETIYPEIQPTVPSIPVSNNQETVPFLIPNTMVYPSTQETDHQYALETPLEDIFTEKISVNKDDIDNFEKFKKDAIPFLRKESVTDPDSAGIQGYFWDMKNHNDKLQYGGIARVEQERYVNAVSVDAKTASAANQTVTMNAQTDAAKAKSKNFDPGYLVYIGTFYGKQDGKPYYVYGRYVNTIIPVDTLDANGNYPVEVV